MNTLPREVDLLRSVFALVRERLPVGWSVRADMAVPIGPGHVDAVLELTASDDTRSAFLVEARRSLAPRDLPSVLNQLQLYVAQAPLPAAPLVVARYLMPSTRARLQDEGVSYVDVTGNMHLRLAKPALYIYDRGADRDPWRGPGRPRGDLQGAPAARVVRALVDYAPPVTLPTLAQRAGASVGTTYRVAEFLQQEALIEREHRGPIAEVAWRRLLQRWSQDYGFQSNNVVGKFLQPRGLPSVLEHLATVQDLRYVLTGSLAAHALAPYAPARNAMIYVDDIERAAALLKLRRVDAGANVLLAAGDYDVVFVRPSITNGVTHAAPSQVAVDLLTSPGRGPAEAQALLDWMETHEASWRR